MDTPDAPRTLEYLDIDELRPALTNPKAHADAELAAAVERFGYTEPPMLDERTGRLVVGHGRLESLQARRKAGKAPPDGIVCAEDGRWLMPVVRGWHSKSDAEARAYIITSNRLTELGGWKQDQLYDDLASVKLDTGDLAGIGFTDRDLEALKIQVKGHDRSRPESDDIPEPPPPTTRPGDLWLLGPHRLLCGDATRREDYERVLDKHLPGAVVTDPPYGVGIGEKNRALDSIDRAGRVLTDLKGDLGIEDVEVLWRASFGVLREVIPAGCPYYVFGPQGGELGLLLLLLLRDAGLSPRHILIWVKNRPSFSIGRLDYEYQHEPIVYGWKPGAAHPWHADGTRTSILNFDRPNASPLHPTAKPVELLRHLTLNSTARGDVVLDPFGGSGSSLIAAEQAGRVACLLEIDPVYCDVICRRWEGYTDQPALLEGTGQAFSAVQRAEAAPVAG